MLNDFELYESLLKHSVLRFPYSFGLVYAWRSRSLKVVW